MTDLPYTDEDLRTEATRQHATLTEDPDFMGVGEQMQDSLVPSTMPVGQTWADYLPDEDDFTTAQRKIGDLISHAADTSRWAIDLGADGLEPDSHTFQLGAQGPNDDDPDEPFVRMHFAFSPDAPAEQRDRFVMQLTKVIAANL